jgi:hypothetical protein
VVVWSGPSEEVRRFPLPWDVVPGDTIVLQLLQTAPSLPGDYTVVFGIEQAGRRWPDYSSTWRVSIEA